MMGECVMSIYGIARSLASRELGPAQLLPAVDDFRVRSAEAAVAVAPMLARLEGLAHPTCLAEPVHALVSEVRAVIADVEETFARAGKLGARARLELERNIERVGGQLQASHRVVGVMDATLAPRPIKLSLSDLLRGRWAPQPTFVTRRLELCVKLSAGQRFEADPKVVWAVVEHMLHEVPPMLSTVFAHVDHVSGDPGVAVLRVGDVPGLSRTSLMRSPIELGPRLAVERVLLPAIMSHLGWVSSSEHDEMRVAIAAA